jgi:hypothetical protein
MVYQTVRPSGRKMEAIGIWERILLGERVGERWYWLFEQMKDRPLGSATKWLWQRFELVPSPVREAKSSALTNFPGLCQFLE